MTLKSHIIQAAAFSAVAALFLNVYENAVFFLSIVFIDIDHYLDFVAVFHKISPRKMFRYYDWLWGQKHRAYTVSVFHTAEVFLILSALGFVSRYFWIILAGFLLHMAFDMVFLAWHRAFHVRAFSIIEYLILRKSNSKGYPDPGPDFWA